ncbi:MAG: lysogenization regulator HflD [Bermanella sp.]|nr:lysogenization regulator HflD [Bermanella sp.]|tara:strand:+ start:1240 stop:1875 length:636 start_codon:yes stop_codon:yes gene_type:complete
MSKANIDNQALALAGLFQAVHLVEQLARTGNVNEKDLKTSIESLFQTHPQSIEDVFGGSRENLKLGYKEVRFLTDGKSPTGSSPDVMRYALAVLHLESKLRKNKKMMPKVSSGIEQAKRQLDHFHSSHENLIANLSGLYQETLSTFRFRIHVTGNAQHLQNTQNAHKIRALLLCAMRSAILWRQVGGRRWQLIFSRPRLNKSCKEALSKMQ